MTAAEPATTAAFPAVDEAQWRQRVAAALKGAPFEKLVGRSYDGVAVQPLYSRAPDASAVPAAHDGDWDQLARVDNPDPGAANRQALTDLENGATGLHLAFRGALGAWGFGLPGDADSIDHALDSVVLETGLPIEIDAGPAAGEVADAIAAVVRARKLDPAMTRISFGLDPLASDSAARALRLRDAGFVGPFLVADARRVHAAGGSEAQELAYALGLALRGLRALEAGGLSLDDARAAISFRLAADADEIFTIAKLRALRLLWARIEEACGLAPRPVRIHAETAWRMMTRRDPWVNLLRATTAAFSAGLGGADAVSVLPFTQALGLPDAFARRLARNTQLILLEESNLGRVADPAAGAGGFEALTREIAQAAWTLFQSAEAQGFDAFLPALSAEVAKVRAARLLNVARRKDPLTGASEFPNVHEAPVDVLAPARALPEDAHFPAFRLAQDFEALRDRADAMSPRPRLFLATLGSVADYTARVMYAKNFFEAGGLETVTQAEGDLVESFRASGARLACLCSSDAIYAGQAADAAHALTQAGATVYLAGRPGDLEQSLKEAGVSDFIFAGANLVEKLDRALALAAGAKP